MELKHFSQVIWRRKWVLLITVLLTTGAVAWASWQMTPQYAATATLWVPASKGGGIGSGDILLADRLMNTYAELATSQPVLDELERKLSVPSDKARGWIKTSPIAQTELLKVTVTHANPRLAAEVATNLAAIVIAETQKTEAGRDLRVSLFAPASIPKDPTWLGLLSTPYWRQINLLLALLFSTLGGLAAATLFEYLDATIHSAAQLENVVDLKLLGQCERVRGKRRLASFPLVRSSTRHMDSFRVLRTNLLAEEPTAPVTILITSAGNREGKSYVASNLALALADSSRKVTLVDANLARPALHHIFGRSSDVGLSDVLGQGSTQAEASQRDGLPGITLLPAGKPSEDRARLLDTPLFGQLLNQLKREAEFVIIDGPAVLPGADAAVIAAQVDSVLLVADCTRTTADSVRAAVQRLKKANASLTGTVANFARGAS